MKEELKNELKSLNSLLSELPHKEYGVSDTPNLDGWEQRMLNIVKDTAPREATQISMWSKMKAPLGVAAMLVAAFGFYFMNIDKIQSGSVNEIETLSYAEMSEYLDEENESVVEVNASDSTKNIEELTDEEIIDYLKEIEGVEVNSKSGTI